LIPVFIPVLIPVCDPIHHINTGWYIQITNGTGWPKVEPADEHLSDLGKTKKKSTWITTHQTKDPLLFSKTIENYFLTIE
jgi:hypothetical protein